MYDNLEKEIKKAIEKKKQNLIVKFRKNGLYENFGQKEVREIQDKYWTDFQNTKISFIIADFDDWCANYIGI